MSISYNTVIGLDVGGTKIRGILYDISEQTIQAVHEEPTATEGLSVFLTQLERFVSLLSEQGGSHPDAIGVGVPSFLDRDRKRVLGSTNFDLLADVALSATLADRLSIPVRIENDANCAALAEALLGAGRGSDIVVAMTLGTGVGGGIVMNGDIYRGAHGGAGEIGYVTVPEVHAGTVVDHPATLEWHASGKFLRDAFGEDDPAAVEQDAREGDKRAQTIYADVGQYLGTAIATIANFFDPDVVVLSGGISHAWDIMQESVQSVLTTSVGSPAVRDGLRVTPALLGLDAGAIGAALLWRKTNS